MLRNASLLIFLSFCLLSIQAQQNKITSILEILNIETGERTTVKEFPSLVGLDKIAANYPSVASEVKSFDITKIKN